MNGGHGDIIPIGNHMVDGIFPQKKRGLLVHIGVKGFMPRPRYSYAHFVERFKHPSAQADPEPTWMDCSEVPRDPSKVDG